MDVLVLILFPAFKKQNTFVGCQVVFCQIKFRHWLIITATQYKKHGYAALGTFKPVRKNFLSLLQGFRGVDIDVYISVFHLESLNTLKYTVIIAHVTQSPRREEKNNLWCRRFRLQLIGMITG